MEYSNGLKLGFAYDKDGMQRLLCTTQQVSNPVQQEVSRLWVVHDWVDADQMIRRTNGITTTPAGCVSVNRLSTMNPSTTYDNRHQMKSRTENGHTQTYKYDGSGNMVRSTFDTDTFDDTMDPQSNRLSHRRQQPANNFRVYNYQNDGARFDENTCPTSASCSDQRHNYRRYLYDGLGRSVGFNGYACVAAAEGSTCSINFAADALYDPAGRLWSPYENGAPSLAYDGENAIRTGADNAGGGAWTFIHGPGVDDPLLGRFPTGNLVAFYITDGGGRQYAVVGRQGENVTLRNEYKEEGGKYAGGTQNSLGFEAERNPSANVSGVSFFRNRIYDQRSGRWTQEDPIGVAGGLNLYQFNGNNPVSNSDPFGLCPCVLPLGISAGQALAVGGTALLTGIVYSARDKIESAVGKVVGWITNAAAGSTLVSGPMGSPPEPPQEPPSKQEAPQPAGPARPFSDGGKPPTGGGDGPVKINPDGTQATVRPGRPDATIKLRPDGGVGKILLNP